MSKSKSGKWQLTQKNLTDRCNFLLKNKKWVDCVFVVGSDTNVKEFHAHQLIMASASPVFEEMIFGVATEEDSRVVIADVKPIVFNELLNYVYSDSLNSDMEMIFDLYYAAKTYMLVELVKKCSEEICDNMSPSIACKSFEFAKLCDDVDMLNCSAEMISLKTDEILADPSIEEISLDTWLHILDTDLLKVTSENDLLRSFETWAKKECERKGLKYTQEDLHSFVGPAVEKFRFLSLTPEEFAKGPAKSLLLAPYEATAIFTDMLSEGTLRSSSISYCTISQERKRPEYKCILDESAFTAKAGRAGIKWVLTFSVDRQVCINGVEVAGPGPIPSSVPDAFYDWSDFMRISLIDREGFKLAEMVEDEEQIRYCIKTIKFHPSVKIQPNEKYHLVVTLRHSGNVSYFNDVKNAVTSEGVTFEFQDAADNEYVVRSIVFS